jgi:hypothetical protein
VERSGLAGMPGRTRHGTEGTAQNFWKNCLSDINQRLTGKRPRYGGLAPIGDSGRDGRQRHMCGVSNGQRAAQQQPATGQRDHGSANRIAIGSCVSNVNKYGPQIVVNNFTRWMMFSNHDVPLQLEESDRRFFVVKCTAPVMDDAERKTYFEAIYAALEDAEAVEGLRRWLMVRDTSRFEAKARAPMTEAKAAMIVEGENPLVEYLRSAVADGTLMNAMGVRFSQEGEFGFGALQDAMKATNFAQHAKNQTELSEALGKAGFTQRRTKTARFWRFPSGATAAVIEATAVTPEKTRRVLTADEADTWVAAGKPGLMTGSGKRRADNPI